MGICLSCLRPNDDDDQSRFDENSPLLDGQQNNYDKLAQLREREEELNKIVDETNEHLIDVTTFFSSNSSITELAVEKPLTGELQDASQLTILQRKARAIGIDQLSSEERSEFEHTESHLFSAIQNETTLQKRGPLIVDFSRATHSKPLQAQK